MILLISEEIWKDIPDYEGLYMVSNLGRVKSLPRKHCKGTILILRDNCYGYLTVGLNKNNVCRRVKVHRIVATVFIPNTNNEQYINHIDGDKHNNNVDNLEWCSRSYNMKHAYSNNLLHTVPVIQMDKNNKMIKIWKGAKYACNTLHIPDSNINKCCKGIRKTAGGYIWKYYDKIGDTNDQSIKEL